MDSNPKLTAIVRQGLHIELHEAYLEEIRAQHTWGEKSRTMSGWVVWKEDGESAERPRHQRRAPSLLDARSITIWAHVRCTRLLGGTAL